MITYYGSSVLFVRPDGGDKAFTGQVWREEDFEGKLWQISTEDMKPDDLLLISSAKLIEREWRVVCSNKKVITGSRYKTAGIPDYRRELPEDVRQFSEKIIATEWQPDPIYVLDICRDRSGNLWLLEIGAFNVAGLYHCEFDKIVEAVEDLLPVIKLTEIECIGCDEMFTPEQKGDMFCSKCSETYIQCGCKWEDGCLCYTR
jgi:hypothetical protein